MQIRDPLEEALLEVYWHLRGAERRHSQFYAKRDSRRRVRQFATRVRSFWTGLPENPLLPPAVAPLPWWPRPCGAWPATATSGRFEDSTSKGTFQHMLLQRGATVAGALGKFPTAFCCRRRF